MCADNTSLIEKPLKLGKVSIARLREGSVVDAGDTSSGIAPEDFVEDMVKDMVEGIKVEGMGNIEEGDEGCGQEDERGRSGHPRKTTNHQSLDFSFSLFWIFLPAKIIFLRSLWKTQHQAVDLFLRGTMEKQNSCGRDRAKCQEKQTFHSLGIPCLRRAGLEDLAGARSRCGLTKSNTERAEPAAGTRWMTAGECSG